MFAIVHAQAQYIMQIPFKKTRQNCVIEIKKKHLDINGWEGHAFSGAVLYFYTPIAAQNHTAYTYVPFDFESPFFVTFDYFILCEVKINIYSGCVTGCRLSVR